MKSKLFLIVFCAGCAAAGFGQSLLGLTFPYGVPVQENSGMSLTMGGAGCAVADDYNVMLKNPANLGAVDRTVLSALFSVDMLRISDGGSQTNFLSGVPTQVSIGIPFGVAGTVGLSYELRSDCSAFFRDWTSVPYNGSFAAESLGLAARGGLVAWQVGWGYSILKAVQIGISYERFYLSAEQTRLSTLNVSGVQTNSRDSMKVEGRYNGVRAGVTVPVGKVRLAVSGEYNFTGETQSFTGVYSNGSTVPSANSYATQTFDLRLPPSLSLGASYDISPEWLVASDVSFGFWQQSQFPGMLAQPGATTTTGVSLGAQYIPAPNLLTPKYWETIRYRAGFRFTQLPGKDSYEYMLSLGTGLPLGKSFGLLDIGLEIGRRQSGLFKDYSEDILRIGIGFNGGHKWANPAKGTY
jgi:long-subunit fatty acid transport protein